MAAGDVGKIFGKGSVIEQILVWQVLGQILAAVMAPELRLLENSVNQLSQEVPLPPADLADMVVRAVLPDHQAADEARKSGIPPGDFELLVKNAGEPPGIQALIEAWRRGFIPEAGLGPDQTSLIQGIFESRVKNKWFGTLLALATRPVPTADAVDAVVKGQIDYAEGEKRAYEDGFDRDAFRVLVNTRGNPPSPVELVELLRREFIPLEGVGPDVLSFQQGIYEGASKNKWWRLFSHLADYIPPPRTVTALIREGSITDEEGLALFKQSGLSEQLAAAYVHSAHHQKLHADKLLAKADIEQLYRDRIISAEDATSALKVLGWTDTEIPLLLALQDVKRSIAALNQAIGRVHNLYVNHKLDKTQALGALNSLHVPDAQIQQMIPDWDIERSSNVKVLTPAEIASAYYYQIIDQATAQAELVAQGFQPFEAWILLSVRMHKAQPNRPAGVLTASSG
jgi:hypothetical protein